MNDTEDQRIAQVAELRAAGRSVRQIAAETGLSKTTVSRLANLEQDSGEQPQDTPDEARDTPATIPEDPQPADEPTPVDKAAELRHHANELRKEAAEARRQVPQILDEAQAQSRRLAARAIQADREADELSRRAIDLEQPQPAIGHRFGRVG